MFQILSPFFYIDSISIIMLFLIMFIGVSIGGFAFRYLRGDIRYNVFFLYLILLMISLTIMVTADQLALLLGSWCASNFFLVKLMIHKSNWKAARHSGLLAAKNFFFGAICIGIALTLLYLATGETSIKRLNYQHPKTLQMMLALFFLLIGAGVQSAILPFHRWLISSLNSPTPVSAIMHAGLVNGGGFLLIRFAPLLIENTQILNVIFLIGMITAIVGTYWKLMQSDIKRMLACSTVGQMGFMLAQCGLGLFPSAMAHLVTHGMFKAYLFLTSGSAAQQKRYHFDYPPKAKNFGRALLCGLFGSYSFSVTSGEIWFAKDSTLVVTVIVFLTASQLALSILSTKMGFKTLLALIVAGMMGLVYGFNIFLITKMMEPMQLMRPQSLNKLHVLAIVFLVLSWLSMLFFRSIKKIKFLHPWIMRTYVATLNSIQPHPKTVTTYRNQYKYL